MILLASTEIPLWLAVPLGVVLFVGGVVVLSSCGRPFRRRKD